MPDRTSYSISFGETPDYVRHSGRKKVGVRFSKEEIKNLAIAVSVLTVCFSVAFTSNGIFFGINPISILTYLPVSFLAVLTAFLFHEIGHKIVANHFGHPAAFHYSKQGLIFAGIVSILFGWLIAAPGAVYIFGHPTKKENGMISLAGPLTNLILGFIFIVLFVSFAIIGIFFTLSNFLASSFLLVAIVNLFLGAFNMIPVIPFDGSKILKWNKPIYYTLLIFLVVPVIYFLFLF